MWQALEPVILQALVVLIPAVTALVLAWLRARAQVTLARECVQEIETEAEHKPHLRGPIKLAMAVSRMKARSSVLTKPTTNRAEDLVEKVLPSVKAHSMPPRESRTGMSADIRSRH
jgi:hypothetical protein